MRSKPKVKERRKASDIKLKMDNSLLGNNIEIHGIHAFENEEVK